MKHTCSENDVLSYSRKRHQRCVSRVQLPQVLVTEPLLQTPHSVRQLSPFCSSSYLALQ